ncbi:MAG: iron-containing alcohol dehydrogenase [Candidatus Cloacimonadales bacterium]|jgi:alcohol dehydrogenase|nr:iron-containing alcohol dehydrogenase [Candidatus Cloacimonadota bacterium]MDY0381721.1 iron-containing alcohol dehydrogenase [Candidatus Cloacimonadaceae bacterium]MCB5256458.1 iron-containing alcohol dehydrogenase [Candidatus Cloacimonadota bacterium]MCB5277127.1 iron-containing alcohol dehydrogenase [Candidatus Cloacimonadota bacterium]MCK9434314.1 iron-containing alcohol dehydrogenase [Candidatus Cloacimonadota bacterium]
MWETQIDLNAIFELRSRTTDYFGLGAINKMHDIAKKLSEMGIKKVLILTGGSSYRKNGAWAVVELALTTAGINHVLYNKVSSNPTDAQVDEATQMGRQFGAEAVIGIGGGSPIDAAKSSAILMEYPNRTARELYEFKFSPERALPIIAINTTHGTGSEVNRFAVVTISELEYKPAIAYDCIYPLYAIDDPALMYGLPENQTRYVSVDAVNHVIEATTTLAANPYAIMMGKETIRLVAKYLPIALENPKDSAARYFLTYASAIAGISFDNGLLHFTHALEHPLSAIKPELAHGLGLSMLLPAVVQEIYPARPKVLADIFEPIIPGLKGEASEAVMVAKAIESWLFSLGITSKLADEGFGAKDIDRLVELTQQTPSLELLLSMAPVKADAGSIRRIFSNSLKAL